MNVYVDDDVICVVHPEALEISGGHQIHELIRLISKPSDYGNSGRILKNLRS